MAKAPNGERVVAFKGDTLESLAGLVAKGLRSSFDVVYVDALHEVSGENDVTNKKTCLSQYNQPWNLPLFEVFQHYWYSPERLYQAHSPISCFGYTRRSEYGIA